MGWRVGDPPLKPLDDSSFEEKLDAIRNGNITIRYTHGQEDFHGPTIGERAAKQVADARAAGLDPVPVGERWV